MMLEYSDTFYPDALAFGGEGPWEIREARSEEDALFLEAQEFVEVHSKTRNWGTVRMMVKSLGKDEGSLPDAA